MIDRIVDFAIQRRVLAILVTLVVIIAGATAFRRLPIEAYPDVADTWVQVIVQWPGHATEEIELQITIPTERVMNGVPRKTSIRSTSVSGLSVVTLLFEDGTDSYFARQQVTERLAHITLPAGVEAQVGPLASPIGEILRYRLVNCATTRTPECNADDVAVPARSLTELKDLQEWVVERELLSTRGVADVISFGGTMKQYHVLTSPTQLAAHNLTLEDVEKALAAANGNAGGGVVRFGRAALNVRGVGQMRPDQIEDIAVAVQDGTPIRVRHVAKVVVGHGTRLGRVSVNADDDVPAATVLLRKGEQAETVLADLHAKIADINGRVLPRGVKLSPHHDRSDLMSVTTRTVLVNLVEGVALVTVVLVVFLGNFRASLLVAMTIPLSLLAAFIFMDAASIPANLLSIGAVDFGMIVDGAIIVVENVFREATEQREGKTDLREVVRVATRRVARPVVFAIAIIVFSYMPIFTLERVEGKLFRPMAWTVSAALAAALLISITLVPALASLLFNRKMKEFHNPVLTIVQRAYIPLLRRALARPRAVLALCGVLLVGDVALTRAVGTEFLPQLDEGAIWMRASMPANISLEEALVLVDGVHDGKRDVLGIREILRRHPEIATISTQVGRPDDGTDPVGFYNAEFLLVLKDRKEWRKELGGHKDALISLISHDVGVIPGVVFGFSQPISDNVEEALTGVKGQIAIKIEGDDLNALDDMADQIARTIRDVPGVVDLGIFRELGQSNVQIQIVRERAERFGLTVAQVEDVVEHGIGGTTVTKIVEGERHYDVVVRYEKDVRGSVAAIRRLLVPTSGGRLVPLSALADIKIVGGASRIFRENGRRYIAIKFGVRDRDLGSTVDEAQARVAKEVRISRGYTVTWGGEFESARRASRRLAVVVPATILAILVLLFMLFRDGRLALIVLATVLLTSPVGGLAALVVTSTNFSVSSGVGFLALFGASVQIGVILVSRVTDPSVPAEELDDTILHGAKTLVRPIIMAALAATLGLVPAAMSTGIGSDSQKPLAIVVVGGLMSSLGLSLFVLPVLYKLFAPSRPRS